MGEKPSHFLQRMRSMVEKNVPDSVLKTVFLEQVLQSLYDVLAVNPDADLTTLLYFNQMADSKSSKEMNYCKWFRYFTYIRSWRRYK
ncbi:hypothetical protein QLX08_005313 [Tetragonisca angustula]|uniref:Uncharacterized protein n=1 Tax=Tetragonisca angustula TaxID=166442 RepID=A0AAW0ZYX8_9HYME